MKTFNKVLITFLLMAAGCSNDVCSKKDNISDETLIQARDEGIDYCFAFQRAVEKNPTQLKIILRFSLKADTAGAIGHGIVLLEIMDRVGDDYFSKTLRTEEKKVIQSVYSSIKIGSDYAQKKDSSLPTLRNKFPKTFMLFKE